MKEAECITSITLLKSSAEFTMICAPKIFFHLVSLQGLIQTDLKPSALKRARHHKWLCSHSKQNRKRGFTCSYVYICVCTSTHLNDQLFLQKGRKTFQSFILASGHRTTKHMLVQKACLVCWAAPGYHLLSSPVLANEPQSFWQTEERQGSTRHNPRSCLLVGVSATHKYFYKGNHSIMCQM